MRNKRKWLGILVLVFGVLVVGCDNGSTNGNSDNGLTNGDTHIHSYSTTWSSNDTQHWHECSCGAKTDMENHIFYGDICEVCNYDKSINNIATSFRVSFNENGGSTISNQTVNINDKVTEVNTIRDGYTLEGWYKESNFITKWNFAIDTVTQNTTLYARWKLDQMPTSYINISSDTWKEGSIDGTEMWFIFTATSTKQYIHLNYPATSSFTVAIYNNLGMAVTSNQSLYSNIFGHGSTSNDLEIGQTYYIYVRLTGISTSTYKITFSDKSESPNMITLPTEGVIDLIPNAWNDVEVNNSGKEWYSFIANSSNQYLHFIRGTATSYFFTIYGSNGGSIHGGRDNRGPIELEVGKKYYIRFNTGYRGTFQLAYNDSTTPPPITLPTGSSILLSPNTWATGTTNDGEWYSFTANAITQYIHFDFTSAVGADIQVYDSIGTLLGSHSVGVRNSIGEIPIYFSRDFISGSVYFLYVTRGTYDGEFRIAFTETVTPPNIALPTEGIIELSANTWSNASIAHNGKQWFKFIANSSTQYIHVNGFYSGISISLRLYDINGKAVGAPYRCNDTNPISRTVTPGQVYFIKAEGIGYSNEYKICFNASETPPVLE